MLRRNLQAHTHWFLLIDSMAEGAASLWTGEARHDEKPAQAVFSARRSAFSLRTSMRFALMLLRIIGAMVSP